MSLAEIKAFNAGVAAVITLAADEATRLGSSSTSLLRRELVIATLRALVMEAGYLLRPEESDRRWNPTGRHVAGQ